MVVGYDIWIVVGGVDKGGILVKEQQSLASNKLDERLSTGARVRQVDLVGDRLHYELLSGTGPARGWVSTVSGTKPLLEKAPFETPTSRISFDTPLPERVPDEFLKTLEDITPERRQDVYQHIDELAKGEYFGLIFPFTGDQVREFGPEWLTKALHAAGTLSKDNSVTKFIDGKFFAGGGAGLKAQMEVEYEKPSDDLHTTLFYKLPLPLPDNNRHITISQFLEGHEVIFNRYFNHCLPFRTPKFYFGDISLKTSNFILISEKLELAPHSTRGKRQEPFQFEAPPLKGMDFSLNDVIAKYHALWRTNAIMAAWCHSGKLGKQFTKIAQKPPLPGVFFSVPEKMFRPNWEQTKDFVLNVGTGVFPTDIANAEYMSQLEPEAIDIAKNIHCFNDYLTALHAGDLGLGLIHINAQVDNAFYWMDEQGRTDCGLLDFGGMVRLSWMGRILGMMIGMASSDFRAHHLESASRLFVDTLAEFGGPKLDAKGFYHEVAISDFKNVIDCMRCVVSGGFGGIYDGLPRDQWSQSITMHDEIWFKEDVRTMMMRNPVVGLVEGIGAWKKGGYYALFNKWREEFGKKPAAKPTKK